MPQMSPLYWLILMFYFILILIFMTTLIYFTISMKPKYLMEKTFMKDMNWLW